MLLFGGMSETVRTGITPIDIGAPEGILRNSFILISGDAGSGKSVVTYYIAKRFIEMREPVIYVALDDDPFAITDSLKLLNIDLSPAAEGGLIRFIDGFSWRLGPMRRIHELVAKEVRTDDPQNIIKALTDLISEMNVSGRGVLIIDSINELTFTLDIRGAVNFVKTVRALTSKARRILAFATLHTTTSDTVELKRSLEYLVDGVIDIGIDPNLQQLGIPVKQLIVKKMKGVPTTPVWIPYVITGDGIKLVDQQKLAALLKSRIREAIGTMTT